MFAKLYRQIQDQLPKINGVRQILEGKYMGTIAGTFSRKGDYGICILGSLNSKFEYTLQKIRAKGKLRDRREHFEPWHQHVAFPWVQSKGNQIILEKNLGSLCTPDYKTGPDLEYEQR